jgi:hypothetical protein
MVYVSLLNRDNLQIQSQLHGVGRLLYAVCHHGVRMIYVFSFDDKNPNKVLSGIQRACMHMHSGRAFLQAVPHRSLARHITKTLIYLTSCVLPSSRVRILTIHDIQWMDTISWRLS